MTCNKGVISGKATLRIKADGIDTNSIRVEGTVSIKPGVVTREAVDGAGFSLNETNSYIEASIYDACGLSIHALAAICGDSDLVTVGLANGKAYSMSSPSLVGDVATSSEGTIALRFESIEPLEEVLGC